MKKLLCYWVEDSGYKFRREQHLELKNRLVQLESQINFEFNRKSRSAKHVGFWKATEYKLFLFYLGPILLNQLRLQRNQIKFIIMTF